MTSRIGWAVALGVGLIAGPALADVYVWRFDRVENWIDRAESIHDRRTDYSFADVIEDRWDRFESLADRRDGLVMPRFDRHEWRSVRRILRDN